MPEKDAWRPFSIFGHIWMMLTPDLLQKRKSLFQKRKKFVQSQNIEFENIMPTIFRHREIIDSWTEWFLRLFTDKISVITDGIESPTGFHILQKSCQNYRSLVHMEAFFWKDNLVDRLHVLLCWCGIGALYSIEKVLFTDVTLN